MISTKSRKDSLLRTEAPPIKDPVDFNLVLPACDVKTLSNGVQVYLLNMGTEDTMMINWVFYAGNCFEKRRQLQQQQITCLKMELRDCPHLSSMNTLNSMVHI